MYTEITDISNSTTPPWPGAAAAKRARTVAAFPLPVSRLCAKWIVPIVLVGFAVAAGARLKPWVWMWLLAAALFFAAKWITLHAWLIQTRQIAWRRVLGYAFLWPGLDIRAFCRAAPVRSPSIREWFIAGTKVSAGALILWVVVPALPGSHSPMVGWVGMIGLILLLHFGSFHLLSLVWRARGVDAKPLMRSPCRAASLAEFWCGRWNSAFTDLMSQQLFKPLARKAAPPLALMIVFLLSGLLHEVVISLPARGGYGLPTLYFLLQGLGLIAERSGMGQALGMGSGFRGWCFVLLIAGFPAFVLFHPAFIRNVVLPMLHAIGAT